MKKLVLAVVLVFALLLSVSSSALAVSPNGSASNMPTYYDDQLFTINFMELPRGGEAAVLAKNKSINIIYTSEEILPGSKPFISVIDAIPGDGFNPLWQEIEIVFNAGHTPRQLTSDEDVLAAAASGEITLVITDEIYRCSVVGSKK